MRSERSLVLGLLCASSAWAAPCDDVTVSPKILQKEYSQRELEERRTFLADAAALGLTTPPPTSPSVLACAQIEQLDQALRQHNHRDLSPSEVRAAEITVPDALWATNALLIRCWDDDGACDGASIPLAQLESRRECVATLLGPEIVLTAGHCVADVCLASRPGDPVQCGVAYNPSELTREGTATLVRASVVLATEYDGEPADPDWALLRLASPVSLKSYPRVSQLTASTDDGFVLAPASATSGTHHPSSYTRVRLSRTRDAVNSEFDKGASGAAVFDATGAVIVGILESAGGRSATQIEPGSAFSDPLRRAESFVRADNSYRQQGEDTQTLMLEAERLLRSGNRDAAEAQFRLVLARAPRDVDLRFRLAAALDGANGHSLGPAIAALEPIATDELAAPPAVRARASYNIACYCHKSGTCGIDKTMQHLTTALQLAPVRYGEAFLTDDYLRGLPDAAPAAWAQLQTLVSEQLGRASEADWLAVFRPRIDPTAAIRHTLAANEVDKARVDPPGSALRLLALARAIEADPTNPTARGLYIEAARLASLSGPAPKRRAFEQLAVELAPTPP